MAGQIAIKVIDEVLGDSNKVTHLVIVLSVLALPFSVALYNVVEAPRLLWAASGSAICTAIIWRLVKKLKSNRASKDTGARGDD